MRGGKLSEAETQLGGVPGGCNCYKCVHERVCVCLQVSVCPSVVGCMCVSAWVECAHMCLYMRVFALGGKCVYVCAWLCACRVHACVIACCVHECIHLCSCMHDLLCKSMLCAQVSVCLCWCVLCA